MGKHQHYLGWCQGRQDGPGVDYGINISSYKMHDLQSRVNASSGHLYVLWILVVLMQSMPERCLDDLIEYYLYASSRDCAQMGDCGTSKRLRDEIWASTRGFFIDTMG